MILPVLYPTWQGGTLRSSWLNPCVGPSYFLCHFCQSRDLLSFQVAIVPLLMFRRVRFPALLDRILWSMSFSPVFNVEFHVFLVGLPKAAAIDGWEANFFFTLVAMASLLFLITLLMLLFVLSVVVSSNEYVLTYSVVW